MKKILLPVVLLSFLFFSCKKDGQHLVPINSGSKKYAVRFNVDGFQQIHISAAKVGGLLNHPQKSSAIHASAGNEPVLYYAVYDSGGHFIHNIVQPADSGGTTTVKDSLPAGSYTFGFAVGGAAMQVEPDQQIVTYPYAPQAYGLGPAWQDTFTRLVSFTVGNGNVTQNVTLTRLVAELEVDVTGAIPTNATTFEIKVDTEYVYGKLAGGIDTTQGEYGVSQRYTILPMTPTITKYDLILLNTITPFNVDITAYDASGALLTEAKISGVKCAVNTRTVLTGSLFGSGSNNVSISLNTAWNPNPYTTINF